MRYVIVGLNAIIYYHIIKTFVIKPNITSVRAIIKNSDSIYTSDVLPIPPIRASLVLSSSVMLNKAYACSCFMHMA